MIAKHKQLVKHNPSEGLFGDCYRTSVACILNKDPSEVPHVFEEIGVNPDDAAEQMLEYLRSEGYESIELCYGPDYDLEDVLNISKLNNSTLPFILTACVGKTNHCVIVQGGEIIHDVSHTPCPIIGPCNDTEVWHLEYIIRSPSWVN